MFCYHEWSQADLYTDCPFLIWIVLCFLFLNGVCRWISKYKTTEAIIQNLALDTCRIDLLTLNLFAVSISSVEPFKCIDVALINNTQTSYTGSDILWWPWKNSMMTCSCDYTTPLRFNLVAISSSLIVANFADLNL